MRKRIEMGWMLLFAAVSAGVLVLILTNGAYVAKNVRAFVWPQWAMLAAGLAGMAMLFGIAGRVRRKRHRGAWMLAPWAVLFMVQVAASYACYFIAGWDVYTVLTSAYAIAGGDTQIDQYYFSLYPNNVMLTMIFAAVMRAFRVVAEGAGLDRCVLVLIVMQCALNTCTGMLCARVARRWMGVDAFAWAAGFVYTAIAGISPWITVPYSDSMGLVFPVLLCALYQRQWEMRRPAPLWLTIGAASGLGVLIKPQIAIVVITIVMTEAVRLFHAGRFRALALRVCCAVCAMCLMMGAAWTAVRRSGLFEFRQGYAMGPMHFAMMGLNEQTTGSYSAEDVALSLSTLDEAQKREVQTEEITRRLKQMGAGGLARHIARKTLVNYGDGMMGWGAEGGFIREQIEDKHPVISPALKAVITPGTRQNDALAAWMQAVWLALLAGMPCCAAAYRRMRGDEQRTAMMLMLTLAVAGLTAFEWIFEARARYLFTFLPLYVLLGLAGLQQVWSLVARPLQRSGQAS